jgi:UPF0271 protein
MNAEPTVRALIPSDFDLNCDLGEGEPWTRTEALLARVTSANVACGGHAGDEATLARVLAAGRRLGVRSGAHPGSPGEFGRGSGAVSAEALRSLLDEQLSRFSRAAQAAGVPAHHLKLHGQLYGAANADPGLAAVTLDALRRHLPGAVLYAPPAGALADQAADWGLGLWPEGFADRGYRDDGTLVPRNEPGAVWTDPERVTERIRVWRQTGRVQTASGGWLALPVRTWCVHGDTPGAEGLVARVAAALE